VSGLVVFMTADVRRINSAGVAAGTLRGRHDPVSLTCSCGDALDVPAPTCPLHHVDIGHSDLVAGTQNA